MDVEPIALAGVWYRQIPAGGDPLYRPPDPGDSRWQRGSVVEAIYFADSEATAWAEWYRALAEAALPPQQALPRDLWRWRVKLPRAADLSDLDRHGLPPDTARAWPSGPCSQRNKPAGRSYAALIAASAARPEGRTLCVFRTTRNVPGCTPLPPPARVPEPPLVPIGLRT